MRPLLLLATVASAAAAALQPLSTNKIDVSKAATAITPHNTLLSWAVSSGCAIGPINIAASSFGGGVGMFATEDISKDTLLFSTPRRLQISLDAALADPDCGDAFRVEVEDGGAMSVLCTYIAKQHLTADSPYLSTLPELTTDSSIQHWSEAELALFAGSAAHEQAKRVREEANEAVEFALRLSELDEWDDQTIAAAVRGAHACILSRSFAMEADDPNARELIPLLDVLQHSEPPSVSYAYEWLPKQGGGDREELEPCTVARAMRDIPKGEELLNSYGDHPSFVLATHYGFVPGAADAFAAELSGVEVGVEGDTASWACELRLSGEGERIGPSIVLAAQQRAAQMIEAGEYAYLPAEEGSGAEAEEEDEEEEDDEEEDVQFALASLLLEAHAWVSYPLKFAVSNDGLNHAISAVAEGKRPSNENGMEALLVCARLCALDLAEMGDDEAEDDPNELLEGALRTLLFSESGRISEANDKAAAALIREAAEAQLDELLAVEEEQVEADDKSIEILDAGFMPGRVHGGEAAETRDECKRLSIEVRAAEASVLRRAMGGDLERLFGL